MSASIEGCISRSCTSESSGGLDRNRLEINSDTLDNKGVPFDLSRLETLPSSVSEAFSGGDIDGDRAEGSCIEMYTV